MSSFLLSLLKISLSIILLFLPLITPYTSAKEPKKIVTSDFAVADTLNALNHPPLAMSGLTLYRQLYREKLLPDTLELGIRSQPNLEYLALLQPDVILISPPALSSLEGKLSRVANVIPVQLLWREREVLPSLAGMTKYLGELSDKQHEAQELIDTSKARLAVIAAKIQRPARPLLIAEIRDDRHVRVFGPGSLEDMVLSHLGLVNAWQGSTNNWGYSTLTIAEAFQLEARIILLLPAYSDSVSPTSGLWQHWLDDTSVSIEVNYWPWGGFPSALRFAESLKEALENT